MAAYPNSQIVPNASAVHGAEITLVFGTMSNTPMSVGIKSTPDEEVLSKLMRRAWAEFAKDPYKGLTEKLGWPMYKAKEQSLVRLGYQNQPKADIVRGDIYDQDCGIMNTYMQMMDMISGFAALGVAPKGTGSAPKIPGSAPKGTASA